MSSILADILYIFRGHIRTYSKTFQNDFLGWTWVMLGHVVVLSLVLGQRRAKMKVEVMIQELYHQVTHIW